MERCDKLFLVRLYLHPNNGVLSLAMSAFSLFLGPRSGEEGSRPLERFRKFVFENAFPEG